MKVRLWGTRGSLPSPGADTVRYGGNTTCVSVEGDDRTLLVLDAGTGIRCLGLKLEDDLRRVNILLTHLHMDHLQGLPFFAPLRRRGVEVHIWGPASLWTSASRSESAEKGSISTAGISLRQRLLRYLSPPLFPVSVRELLSDIHFHELASDTFVIGGFTVISQMVLHLNPTLGFRIEEGGRTLAFIPDHEPVISSSAFGRQPEWTSGYALAKGVDLLIHDAQYTREEYQERVGFGHSSLFDAVKFAELARVRRCLLFHHDPAHSDDLLDRLFGELLDEMQPAFEVIPAVEGAEMIL